MCGFWLFLVSKWVLDTDTLLAQGLVNPIMPSVCPDGPVV